MDDTANHTGLGADSDAFYQALLETHAGLDEAESHALNARLVLLMANEIGALDRLKKLMAEARAAADG